jgi:hypothetical protein
MTLSNLISRLEAASEGSEELDVAITRATCGYKPTDPLWHTMEFTRSLDAALTLVPEGYGFVVSDADWKTARASVAWKNTPADFDAPYRDVRAATPALALCIASLRAREQDDG